VRTAEKEKNY
jgi:hypothetical protein